MTDTQRTALVVSAAVAAIGAVIGLSQITGAPTPVPDASPSHQIAIVCDADNNCELCDAYVNTSSPEISRTANCVQYATPPIVAQPPGKHGSMSQQQQVQNRLASMASVSEQTITLLDGDDARTATGCGCMPLDGSGDDCQWLQPVLGGDPTWATAPTGVVLQPGTWQGGCAPSLCLVMAEMVSGVGGGLSLDYALADVCRPVPAAVPDAGAP
jgi:hypothetical protein